MSPYAVGSIVGAIIVAFLLSRLMLWLGGKWVSGRSRIVVAHAATLAVAFVVAGFGFANGGSFRADAVLVYLVPVGGWMIFDLVRLSTKEASTASDRADAGGD